MTLDEAIARLNDEHKHEFVLEPGQLEKWLTELKEAKRLLKAAINDIYKECTCDTWGCGICEHSRETCDYDDRFTWRHKAEALKLIEEEEK